MATATVRLTPADRVALDALRSVGGFTSDGAAIRSALYHFGRRQFDLPWPTDLFAREEPRTSTAARRGPVRRRAG